MVVKDSITKLQATLQSSGMRICFLLHFFIDIKIVEGPFSDFQSMIECLIKWDMFALTIFICFLIKLNSIWIEKLKRKRELFFCSPLIKNKVKIIFLLFMPYQK